MGLRRAIGFGSADQGCRGLLGWTARDLARRAIVSVATVNLIEEATGLPSTTKPQLEAVQAALEAAGIEFLDGDAPGLRLRTNKTKKKK